MLPAAGERVVAHDLAAPSIDDFRSAIERVARGQASVWRRICENAGVDDALTGVDFVAMELLVDAARAEGGVVEVAAVSMGVRLKTFYTLSSLERSGYLR